jgi:uncharacterized membrane protein
MMSLDLFLSALALVACLACGLVAGVFFAFSAFVMKALARIAPSEGIAAMQSINVVVLNVWFLSLFLGTAAICVVALVVSLLRWSESGMAWMLAGGLLYLAGTVLVTIACNVPRNEALAKIAPSPVGLPGTTSGPRPRSLRRRASARSSHAKPTGAKDSASAFPEHRSEPIKHACPAALDAARLLQRGPFLDQGQLASSALRDDFNAYANFPLR